MILATSVDFSTIGTIISTVGFPIVACIGIFYLYNKTIVDITNVLGKITETMNCLCDKQNDTLLILEKLSAIVDKISKSR